MAARSYRWVLPMLELIEQAEMAETVGVSQSQVSREFIEASEKALMERRFDDKTVISFPGYSSSRIWECPIPTEAAQRQAPERVGRH